MPRLHITRIVSIGAVEQGDNPESQILLFKSKPTPQDPANAERSKTEVEPQGENDMRTTKIGPGEVRGEVDRLAAELIEKGEATSLAEARAEVWRRNPDLVAKSRKRHFSEPVSETGETVADRIGQVVRDAADRAVRKSGVLWTDWGRDQQQGPVRAQARAAAWRTEEGRLLRDLATAHGGAPYPSGVAKIEKRREGDRFAKALRILDDGFEL